MGVLDLSKVEFSVFDRKRNISIPTHLTEDLAEDIGIQIGEGHIGFYRYGTNIEYLIQCSGHPTDDYNWFRGFVLPLKNYLFNLNLFLTDHHDGSITIFFRSKAIFTFYTKVIGLPIGKKKNVGIPKIILTSNDSIKKAFLRGIFDSDFSITFKKKYRQFHYYPVITATFASKNLRDAIIVMLRELGFSNISIDNREVFDKRTNNLYTKYSLFISGSKMLLKWFTEIGSNNIKNIAKFSIWIKNGFYPPELSHEQRIKILIEEINPINFYGPCKI